MPRLFLTFVAVPYQSTTILDYTNRGHGQTQGQNMIAGHIGAAAGAKRWAPNVPVWALLVGSFLIDLIFGILYATGKENIEAMEGTDGGYGKMAFQVDWSHSFFGTILLCTVVVIVATRFFGGKGAFILSCVVFSHWFLDVIVHRPDMPIAPGNPGAMPRVGLGMWDFPVFVLILELALIAGGAWLWDSAPESGDKARKGAIALAIAAVAILIWDFTA